MSDIVKDAEQILRRAKSRLLHPAAEVMIERRKRPSFKERFQRWFYG